MGLYVRHRETELILYHGVIMGGMKLRLDKMLVARGLIESRSQAENYIRLGSILVNKKVIRKAGFLVDGQDQIQLSLQERYVSRAGLKLASVAQDFRLSFQGKVVLDIGSSTGGFTDFALQHGAKKVIAVDVGTDQLHPKLRTDPRVELHEKTDIRDFFTTEAIDLIMSDVSFISMRLLLPHVVKNLTNMKTCVIVMVKPQFEAGRAMVSKGVVKNNSIRRNILADFENWARRYFVIVNKRDSSVAGAQGNIERFYVFKKLPTQ